MSILDPESVREFEVLRRWAWGVVVGMAGLFYVGAFAGVVAAIVGMRPLGAIGDAVGGVLLAVYALLPPVLVGHSWWAWARVRARSRNANHALCPRCGYRVRELTEIRQCPECGGGFPGGSLRALNRTYFERAWNSAVMSCPAQMRAFWRRDGGTG